jgi:spermidine synthase
VRPPVIEEGLPLTKSTTRRSAAPSSVESSSERAAGLAPLLATAFFLSGFAALTYELLWFRQLGHVFGSTATAASTLLAAYLFGLGLGAWGFGKLSDRWGARPLLYVAIEVGIGLYGIASHALLERGASLYELTHAWAEGSAGRLLFVRFAVSFVLVAVPTTLMGGTFPLMVHLLKVRRVDVGRATGRAYAVNTAGAAAGAIALPSLLLPFLGIESSLFVAAVANFAAAGATWWYSRRVKAEPALASAPAAASASAPAPAAAPARRSAGRALLLGFFLSSFASLALETVWTRHLCIFFGAQIFTFAFVLFGYLLGLFIGGGAYAKYSARGVEPTKLLRGGLLLAAVSVAATLPFLDRLPVPQVELLLAFGVTHANFLLTSGFVIVGLVLLPAIGFGLVFPAVVDLLSREGRRIGASVGLAYVVNTLGTTLGSLGAGFLLVPALGTQRTLEVAVLLIAAALALSGSATAGRWRFVPLAFLAVLVLPRWNWKLAHAMYVKDPVSFLDRYRRGAVEKTMAGYQLTYFKEGTEATVSVCEFKGDVRSLYVNGKPDASNVPEDMIAQRLLALIPALFHPDPKRALVIGVGSGTTVATLKRFPFETIDAAEISPEVGEAAQLKFKDINDDFTADPRVRLRLDDGRNFLRFQPPESYDVIISEPSNPWMAGVSALFTDEFFADVKAKLKPGGVVCQWFHYYNMSLPHIRLLARTFRKHFPQSCLFVLRGAQPTGDIVIIGAKGDLRMARLPDDSTLPTAARAALAEVGNAGTQQLLGGLIATPETFAGFGGDGPLNTDDHPILEFEAPADRFKPDYYMETLHALISSSERLHLGTGARSPAATPPPDVATLRSEGFAPTHGLPEGQPVARGVTVVAAPKGDSDSIERWVLIGREYDAAGVRLGLLRLADAVKTPEEVRDAATALAGAGLVSRTPTKVAGHEAIAVLAESAGLRTIVIAWNCPELQLTLLVSRRAPIGAAPDEGARIAAELAERFPCFHAER